MNIKLIRPALEHKEQALAFKQEFMDNGESVINGSEMLDQTDSYENWLQAVTDNRDLKTCNPKWVVTDTYFAIDDHGTIVGIIDLRHELKGFLVDFGNTGYSVRPSERRKGYATEMLRQIIESAKLADMESLQLSVEQTNEPSIKTILRNGGVYERSFEFEGNQADVYRIIL